MATKKTLLMETTEIPPERTAGEITSELISAGATQITTIYIEGRISGLRWMMRVGVTEVLFDMPVRVEPVYQIFKKRQQTSWLSEEQKQRMRQKAERVAWRQLLRWIQAQVAMIETGMAQAGEVFLPYMFDHSRGQTLFQVMMETQFKMLPAPEKQ